MDVNYPGKPEQVDEEVKVTPPPQPIESGAPAPAEIVPEEPKEAQPDPTQPQKPVSVEDVNKLDAKEILMQTQKTLLKFVSYFMLFHGLLGLYGEMVKLFYVFPYLPKIFEALNYSESIFQTVYRRSLIIGATAVLETIYGLFLLRKQSGLAKSVHLASSVGLLVVSFILLRGIKPLDTSDFDIPQPPTLVNVFRERSIEGVLELYLPRKWRTSTGGMECTESMRVQEVQKVQKA